MRKTRTFHYEGQHSHDRNPTIVVIEENDTSILGINLFKLDEEDRNHVLSSDESVSYDELIEGHEEIKHAVRKYLKVFITNDSNDTKIGIGSRTEILDAIETVVAAIRKSI
jgi:hypothetical protein